MREYSNKYTYEVNYKRHEKILVLPHNTLRVVDAMFQIELESRLFKKIPNFEDNLYRCVCRKYKDYSKCYNTEIPKDLLKKYNENWYYYWDIAPRTDFYSYIKALANQSFTQIVYVLFSDKRASEPEFESVYYDGSIDELEKFIIDNGITAVILDDINILVELHERKNVNLHNMSFIFSRMGYNYYFEPRLGIPILDSKIDKVNADAAIEVATIALYDFSNEVVNRNRRKGNNV